MRRDLTDDPYFLALDGDLEAARKGLDDLAPVRRLFVQQMIADRLALRNAVQSGS